MITIEDITFDALLDNGRSTIEVDIGGGLNSQVVDYEVDVYNASVDDNIRLDYQPYSSFRLILNTGVSAMGKGFLISKLIEGSSTYMGMTFIPYQGKIVDMTENEKDNIVLVYNDAIEGNIVETTVDVGVLPDKILNEDGETSLEQKIREEIESRTSLDGEIYETVQMKNMMDKRYLNSSANNKVLIREEEGTLSAPTITGGQQQRGYRFEMYEVTKGTKRSPVVSYEVDTINTGATIESLRVSASVSVETQEEAETLFDDLISTMTADWAIYAAQVMADSIAAQRTTEITEKTEVYFEKSPLSFEEMLVNAANYEYGETAFRKARIAEVGGARKSGLYDGPYGDAAYWSNGGDTLELDDFDTPRITTEGVTENLSGGVAFTVKQGWQVTFNLKIEDGASFINDAADGNDGIVQNGNDFDFIMSGGDRLEIDIDNEREGIYPFLITSQGRRWSSIEEVDDEISLTMVKAELLVFKYEEIEEVTKTSTGEVVTETVLNEVSGPVNFTSGPLSESQNLIINSEVNGQVNANPAFKESLIYTRDLIINDVPAEGSFVDPDELVEDITEPIKDAADAVWDSVKWWLLGGVVVIVAVVLIGVYVNGRSRRTQVVQAAPVSEA